MYSQAILTAKNLILSIYSFFDKKKYFFDFFDLYFFKC